MSSDDRPLVIDEPLPHVRHRAMEIMGMRAAIRAGTELQALAFHQPASLAYRAELRKNLGRALKERDTPFGDYRGREGARGA